jgi:hypothetical protein
VATQIVSQYVHSAVPSAFEPAVKPHASVYEIVTERILAELENGQVPWRKPWRTLPPANLISKKPYRGINVFLLALAGYGSQYWLTYRQAQALGGNVRRGEHGTKIVFWKFDKYETGTADGETEERTSAFLRYYTVFNLEQCDGLKALLALPLARPIESAEAIVQAMPNPPALGQDYRRVHRPGPSQESAVRVLQAARIWRVAFCRPVWRGQEHHGACAGRRATGRIAQDS